MAARTRTRPRRIALLLALLAVAAQQRLALAQEQQQQLDAAAAAADDDLLFNEEALRARLDSDRAKLDAALADPRAAFEGLVAKLTAGGQVPAVGARARAAAGGSSRAAATLLPFVPGGRGDRLTKAARLRVFRKNLAALRARNLAQADVVYGVTPFTALTQQEFEDIILVKGGLKRAPTAATAAPSSSSAGGRRRLLQAACTTDSTQLVFEDTSLATTAPKETVNWRTAGFVAGVRDQRGCGSCVAFASTVLAEFWAMKKPSLRNAGWNASTTNLSEQDIMLCVTRNNYGGPNQGCTGAYINDYVGRILCRGMATEKAVRYTATDNNQCPTAGRYKGDATGWTFVTAKSSVALRRALSVAPVMVSLDASFISSYSSGVLPCNSSLTNPNNGKARALTLNHAVAAVGYTNKHWILKNSWSTGWGNSGYLFLARECGTVSDGALGITKESPLAFVK